MSMTETYPIEKLLGQALMGVLGGCLAVLTLEVVTWRDAALSLAAGVALAAVSPQAIMLLLGWQDPALLWALALAVGISGKALVVRMAREPLELLEQLWRRL